MDYLNEAERIAFLGKTLTQQLLTFSRGRESHPKHSPAGRSGEVRGGAGSARFPIDCVFDVSSDLLSIEADEEQIGQVIENILRNARESMPAVGRSP